MQKPIPRLTEKLTASFTPTEREKFVKKAKSKGKRPSTHLREVALKEIGA